MVWEERMRLALISNNGVYSFDAVPPGEYTIAVDAPVYRGELTERVSIPDPHACMERPFYLRR